MNAIKRAYKADFWTASVLWEWAGLSADVIGRIPAYPRIADTCLQYLEFFLCHDLQHFFCAKGGHWMFPFRSAMIYDYLFISSRRFFQLSTQMVSTFGYFASWTSSLTTGNISFVRRLCAIQNDTIRALEWTLKGFGWNAVYTIDRVVNILFSDLFFNHQRRSHP